MPVVEVVVRLKLLSQFLGVVFAQLLLDLPAVIGIFFEAGSRNADPLRLAVDFDKLRLDGSFVSALSVIVVVQQDGLFELRVSAYMNNFLLLRHFNEGSSSRAASERTDAAQLQGVRAVFGLNVQFLSHDPVGLQDFALGLARQDKLLAD